MKGRSRTETREGVVSEMILLHHEQNSTKASSIEE